MRTLINDMQKGQQIVYTMSVHPDETLRTTSFNT